MLDDFLSKSKSSYVGFTNQKIDQDAFLRSLQLSIIYREIDARLNPRTPHERQVEFFEKQIEIQEEVRHPKELTPEEKKKYLKEDKPLRRRCKYEGCISILNQENAKKDHFCSIHQVRVSDVLVCRPSGMDDKTYNYYEKWYYKERRS